jgi:hypothetical protein
MCIDKEIFCLIKNLPKDKFEIALKELRNLSKDSEVVLNDANADKQSD